MESRYDKHIKLSDFGQEGQNKLSKSRVVLIGCGALGSNIANLLVRSGVAELKIIDRDMVELGNLQRQVLFSEKDIGSPKAKVAELKLKEVNSEIKINSSVRDVRSSNIFEIVSGYDLIMDGTDNMTVRMIINDISVKECIPWVYGGVLGTGGMAMAVTGNGPCLRCLVPELPEQGEIPTCESFGVINTIPAVIASIQVTEAFKILTGKDPVKGLVRYDIWSHEFTLHDMTKDPDCECCVKSDFKYLKESNEESVSLLCDDAVQIILPGNSEADLELIAGRLKGMENLKVNPFRIEFRTEGKNVTIYKDGRVIIRGTEDLGVARSIYSKFLGL